ncbi:MAG: glycosyltransferase [Gammaproteobacteria bacterium]|jgi:hypothetical protein|nr:glycosyltransferase [Gammaproteobacteria bacterium]
MKYAPIALFAYNRLSHLQQTIESLKQNSIAEHSELFIFSDGAKNTDADEKVQKVRDWLKTITGFKRITIVERQINYGLAKSIIQGVTTLTSQFGKVIVIEDDLIVSPYFLQFMNDGLDFYEHTEIVASIHGYTPALKGQIPQTYFLRGADCWGWATWKRAWKIFEPDGNKLLLQLKENNLMKEFDFDYSQPNIQMLKDQIIGKNNSWAIRWHASAFINNMLTLYPGRSLVNNIGLDNSGEHCAESTVFEVALHLEPVNLKHIPIEKNEMVYKAYVKYFKNVRESIFRKITRKAKAILSI